MNRLPMLLLAACASMPTLELDSGTPDSGTVDAGVKSGVADGMLEAWDTVEPLPIARANHCAVALQNRLVIAGGNYKPAASSDFVTLDDVYAATVAADGTLGNWSLIGHLPSAGIACTLAAQGDTLVLLGGLFADSTLDGNVWTTTVQGDGTLGAWTVAGTLPYGRRLLGPVAELRGSTLWVTDSRLDSESDAGALAVVASATLSNGALSAWTPTQYWPRFRGEPLAAFTPDAIVIAGGYDNSGTLTDTTLVTLGGGPSTQSDLPAPRTFGIAVTADNWVFAIGGRVQSLGGPAVKSVYSAQEVDGALTEWTEQADLPLARSNHQATVVGDWLFVTGGSDNAPGGDTVFRSRVKHAVSVSSSSQ